MHFSRTTFQEQWVTNTLLNGAPKNVRWSIHPTPGRNPTLTATNTNQLGRTKSRELHVQPTPAGALGRHTDILQTIINSVPDDASAGWVPTAKGNAGSNAQTLIRTTTPPTYAVTLRIWNQDPAGINTGGLRAFSNWILTTQATHATIRPATPGVLPTLTLTSLQTGNIADSPYQWVSHTVKVDVNLQQKLNTLESVELDYTTATYMYTPDRENIKYVDYIIPVCKL